jgi:hypothetical protein
MSRTQVKASVKVSSKAEKQEALDAVQTNLQIVSNDLVDVSSVNLTPETIKEMKLLVSMFSRGLMQAELWLNQT